MFASIDTMLDFVIHVDVNIACEVGLKARTLGPEWWDAKETSRMQGARCNQTFYITANDFGASIPAGWNLYCL